MAAGWGDGMLRVWRMWVGGAEQAEPEVTEQLHKKEVRASTIERHSSMRVIGVLGEGDGISGVQRQALFLFGR